MEGMPSQVLMVSITSDSITKLPNDVVPPSGRGELALSPFFVTEPNDASS